MLGLGSSLAKGGASLLTYVKDNLKLYLDFTSNKSDTLKFPCEGSTSFDGSDDGIDCGQIDVSGQNITLSAWVYRDGTTDDTIAGRWNSNGVMLYCSSSSAVWYINGASSSVSIPDKTWVHIVGTFDGANRKIYKDGVLGDTDADTGTIVNPSENFEIGNAEFSSGKAFNGKLANVAIWSRALSAEEINSIMRKNYSQLKSVEKTSLVSWWALDSASNGVVHPATGETLGSELVTSNTTSDWGQYGSGGSESNITNGVALTAGNDGRNAYYTVSGTTNGTLYRLNVDVFIDDASDTNARLDMFDGSASNYSGFLTTSSQNITVYFEDKGSVFVIFNSVDNGTTVSVQNMSIKEVTSNTGVVTGATTTTSVYGGNAPVLPRAVDVAKEGQADAIGNGSASFNGSSDYIEAGNIEISGDATFSIAFWAYWNGSSWVSNFPSVVGNSTQGEGVGLSTTFNAGRPALDFWNVRYRADNALDVKEWYHIAFTKTSGNISSTSKIYVNSIEVSGSLEESDQAPNITNSNINIGRLNDATDRYWNGFISQVGLWQGVLTQAQIQSVMESTSYAKIPASVKSTIGSELFDADASTFDSGTHSWVVYGNNTIANDSGALKITYVDNTNGAYIWLKDASDLNSDLVVGKLYKLTFDAKVNTGSVDLLVIENGGSTPSATITETSFTSKTIIFEAHSTTTEYIRLNIGSGEIVWIDNLSLKEVTNELVGYWALDDDNSVKALEHDGTGDYVYCGTGLGSALTNPSAYSGNLTVSAWIQSDQTAGDDGIWAWDVVGNFGEFDLSGYGNKLRMTVDDNSWRREIAFSSNEWTHVVCVYTAGSESNTRMYVNGADGGDGNTYGTFENIGNLDLDGKRFEIGSYYTSGNYPFQGAIANCAVYSDAKSASFISTQYSNGIDADLSSDSNLIGYWKLDTASTSSNAITDLSSNSNHGTVQGNPTLTAVALDSTTNKNNGRLI